MADEDIKKILTVPLGYIRRYPRPRRAQIAVRHLRKYVARHMRVDVADVSVQDRVNLVIWQRGMRSPPKILKVLATKLLPDERVDVDLPAEEREGAADKKRKPRAEGSAEDEGKEEAGGEGEEAEDEAGEKPGPKRAAKKPKKDTTE